LKYSDLVFTIVNHWSLVCKFVNFMIMIMHLCANKDDHHRLTLCNCSTSQYW